MSSPYTPTPTPLPATIDVPDDGDLEDASSVNVPSETSLDAIANLELPQKNPSESPPIASRDLNIAQRGMVWFDPAEWFLTAARPIPEAIGASATFYIRMDLTFPHGSTVKEFYVYILPTSGHGALPGTMPSWTMYEKNMITGAETPVDSKADTSVNVAAYEVYHPIGHHVTVPFVADREKRYFIVFNNEGGANSDSNLQFHGAVSVCTVTSIDVGAS